MIVQDAQDQKIRVAMIDDHPMMLDALCMSLELEGDMVIVGIAQNAEQGFQLANDTRPEVMVIDLILPGDQDGVDLSREVLKVLPETKILIISSSLNPENVARAISAGVLGYVHKESTRDEFLSCVRQVALGNLFLLPGIANQLFRWTDPVTGQRLTLPGKAEKSTGQDPILNLVQPKPLLTRREKEILSMITRGLSNHEIANELGLSINTITSHVGRIFRKMQFKNRVMAAMYGRDHELGIAKS